jgi:hypothetical protein
MAMLAPVYVENFGRLYGSNQPISAHFTAFNSSDQLQRKRSSIFQEALGRQPVQAAPPGLEASIQRHGEPVERTARFRMF